MNLKKIFNLSLLLSIFVLLMMGCSSGDPYLDPVPPSFAIVKIVPQEDQVNIPVNQAIQVTFEKDINLASLNIHNFSVATRFGQVAGGNITYDKVTKTATYKPSVDLEEGTDYEVVINQGQGENGEYIPPSVFLFRTANQFETVKLTPNNGAVEIKVAGFNKTDISVQFNESLNASGSNNPMISTTFFAQVLAFISLDEIEVMAASPVYDDTIKTLTLKPNSGRLKYSSKYHVTLRDIESVNGGRIDLVQWSFTTQKVRVNATIPSQSTTNISVVSDISIFFQEAIDPNSISGNVKIREAFGIQPVFTFLETPQISSDQKTLLIRTKIQNDDVGLKRNTRYEILVDGVISTQNELYQKFISYFTTEP
ncbi:Ig-like domain-containing protein [bacterium]|nr:Ig-like domain-containing protein [bacterium]